MATKSYIIALEEHYLDPEVKQYGARAPGRRSFHGSTISAHCG